jgi:serine/threonine protein phosphatase 1
MAPGNETATPASRENRPHGRLLAVGDVHGRPDLLQTLLQRVVPTPDDQTVFLGDYIDRGPDPYGVIEYLLDFGKKLPDTIFLKGNHEAMLLDFLAGRNQLLYLLNGGATTLMGYRQDGHIRIPPAHQAFFDSLRLWYETSRFIFVHAGLRPGLPPARQDPEDLLWIREEFLESDYDWGKTVVFGHTPVATPYFAENRIGLDTGAGHGRTLTCCDVRRRQCWNVS